MDRRRKALLREVTKKPMVTLAELQRSWVEMREISRGPTRTATLYWSWLHGRVGKLKPLLSERCMKVCLEIAKKKAPKGLSDRETRSWLFGIRSNRHVWRKSGRWDICFVSFWKNKDRLSDYCKVLLWKVNELNHGFIHIIKSLLPKTNIWTN